jgi:endonuclease/exonuclease/phosphatase (EEP) superfamily protein YafD
VSSDGAAADATATSEKPRGRLDPWGLLSAALAIVAVLTVAGWFSRFWWALDIAAGLRLQYVECALAAAALYGVGRKKRQLAAALAVAAVNAAPILPLYFRGEPTPQGRPCRLLLSNVHSANTEHDRLLALVEHESPDIIVLEEINNTWVSALGELRAAYPHHIEHPESDNFGIALYSRLPLEALEIRMIGEIQVASVHATLMRDGARWHIIATHPLPPGGSAYWRWRNEQLEKLAAYIWQLDGHVVLIGDLNTTPWSHYFRKLLADAGLRNAGGGFGLQPSWPSFCPPLGMQIDHCLVSARLAAADFRTTPSIGSDHYPLVVDIAER